MGVRHFDDIETGTQEKGRTCGMVLNSHTNMNYKAKLSMSIFNLALYFTLEFLQFTIPLYMLFTYVNLTVLVLQWSKSKMFKMRSRSGEGDFSLNSSSYEYQYG